jgi:Skp family chaperone for outer membrane proteins
MKKVLFAAILLVACSFGNSATAQTKIGYFDDQSVIALFPGIQEKLDTVLNSYAKDSLQDEYNYTLKDYQMMEQKQEALLLPYRQKIAQALSEIVAEQKYNLVLKSDALSPYAQPSIADNLTIRVALRLKLPVPKDIEDAFKAATGGAAKPATPAKKG